MLGARQLVAGPSTKTAVRETNMRKCATSAAQVLVVSLAFFSYVGE